MDKDYNSIVVNKDVFTLDDAIEAARQIFETQADDFYALKNEKWYKHLLNAITFGSDRKKKVIKDIRSLSKLQTIFMRVYCENYKGLDSQLNDIIDNIAKTNESVRKIYTKYIVGVASQQGILDLPQLEQDILLLFICSYTSVNGNDERLKRYRAGIAQTIGRGIPQGEFKPEMLEQIKSSDIFYRFIVEMCAIDGGLDDFSVPDNIYEAIDYLTISKKSKEKIEAQIRNELDTLGIDYLISKYGVSEDNIIDGDIELKDEDAVEDKDTVDEEFATIIIDKDLQIANGKQQIYKNKEILIHANIICEGELIFDNCTLKYNDSALPGEIHIREKGQLSINACTFICLSYKDNYFVNCDGNVIIKQTKFMDCSKLFGSIESRNFRNFIVDRCEILNCCNGLFELYADRNTTITISNSKIIQSDLKQFYKDNLKRIFPSAMIKVSLSSGDSQGLQFHNNVIMEEAGFTEIFKDTFMTFFEYIDAGEMSITQSTFINTSGKINALNIEECYFKGCKKPILISVLCKKAHIANCIFEKCENVISADNNTEIMNCQFVSCKNKLIDCDNAFEGGVIVDSCTFKNIQNEFDGSDSDSSRAYSSSALKFMRCKDTSSNMNRVSNCSFDGVEMKKAFLIASDGYEKPWEDTVALVDKCTFSHCVSQRTSKKLIREYFTYKGHFNKEKSVHAIKISNCEGLEKTNSEGLVAENLSINFISTYGRKIGAELTLSD